MTDKTTAPLTLADMTPEERAACAWMQADLADGGRVILDRNGRADGVPDDRVTPCFDLPRLAWPRDPDYYEGEPEMSDQTNPAVLDLPPVTVDELGRPSATVGPAGPAPGAVGETRIGRVVLEEDGRIFTTGVPNPYRSVGQARAHALAILAMCNYLEGDTRD